MSKKAAISLTHTHKHTQRSRPTDSISSFFLSGGGYSRDQTCNYIIQRGGGFHRFVRMAEGRLCCAVNVKLESIGSIVHSSSCLSSAPSVSLSLLDATLTANEISRKRSGLHSVPFFLSLSLCVIHVTLSLLQP